MARIKLLIVFILFACNSAFAGYAQLKPPPGWSQGMGAAVPGQAGVFAFGAAANSATYKGSSVLTNASLTVAGQLVTMPVSMRYAANAASLAYTYSFSNPLLFAGLAVGSLVYDYYKNNGLTVKNGQWWKTEPQITCNGPCYLYGESNGSQGFNFTSAMAAASAYAAARYSPYGTYSITGCSADAADINCNMKYSAGGDTNVWIRRIAQPRIEGEIIRPAIIEDFHLAPGMPVGLPEILPIPLPVIQPAINPDPAIQPAHDPAPAPLSRPLFLPTGNPVPTSDPAIWNQPGVRVSPAPTPDNPWQVDIQPENIPQGSPTPKTPAELNPSGNPVPGTPVLPKPDAGLGLCDQYPGIAACAPAATPQDKIDFCKENPKILACQELDQPDEPDLETKDKAISITPDSGWGSGAGSCPAPRHFSKGEFSFQIYCDFASGIKPVIIAVAWLVAAGILIGFKFGDS